MDWITHVITGSITGVLIGVFLRAERRAPVFGADVAFLEYSRVARWFMRGAAIAFFSLLTWTVVAALLPDATDRDARTAGVAAFVCLPLAIAALCESRVRLAITTTGIGGRTAFRGRREVAWTDVVRVTYSRSAASWVIEGRHREKVRVPRYLVGSSGLLAVFEAKLPPELWRGAVEAWQSHRV